MISKTATVVFGDSQIGVNQYRRASVAVNQQQQNVRHIVKRTAVHDHLPVHVVVHERAPRHKIGTLSGHHDTADAPPVGKLLSPEINQPPFDGASQV